MIIDVKDGREVKNTRIEYGWTLGLGSADLGHDHFYGEASLQASRQDLEMRSRWYGMP